MPYADKEKRNAYQRLQYQKHREKKLAYARTYSRQYRELHPEETRSAVDKWRLEHPDEVREYSRKRRKKTRQDNIESEREKDRLWRRERYRTDPEFREKCARARDRRRAVKHDVLTEPWTPEEIADRDSWVCYLCERPIDPNLKRPNRASLSIDHIKPLSKGGSDLKENLAATHLLCNMAKRDSG